MTVAVGSVETHHALAAAAATRLPVRAIVGQWVRELGAAGGAARFPGPRRNPGNVTSAHVGKVCGTLRGGSATEHHDFPVFCTATDGVTEYAWWMTHLSHYSGIAAAAGGDWRRACDLIERSPWSSDHYGGTLDRTAAISAIELVQVTDPRFAIVHTSPHVGAGNVATTATHGRLLAALADVRGDLHNGSRVWHQVRYGAGDGRVGFIHSSAARRLPALP